MKGRSRPGFLLILGTGAGFLLLIACASESRHRVLTFFFDGVPPIGGEVTTGTQVAGRNRPSVLPRRPSRPIAVPTAPPVVSVHKPFEQKQCRECHNLQSGRGIAINDLQLCDRCHQEQRTREGWSHGPINLGTCVPCHNAHSSPYPHLLSNPVPDLCVTCHEEQPTVVPSYHAVPEYSECLKCHDPHRTTTKGVI